MYPENMICKIFGGRGALKYWQHAVFAVCFLFFCMYDSCKKVISNSLEERYTHAITIDVWRCCIKLLLFPSNAPAKCGVDQMNRYMKDIDRQRAR